MGAEVVRIVLNPPADPKISHFEARKSTISTPSPTRIRIAGSQMFRCALTGAVAGTTSVVVTAVSAMVAGAVPVTADESDAAGGSEVSVAVSGDVDATASGGSDAGVGVDVVDPGFETSPAAGDDVLLVAGAGAAATVGGAAGLGERGAGFATAGFRVLLEEEEEVDERRDDDDADEDRDRDGDAAAFAG